MKEGKPQPQKKRLSKCTSVVFPENDGINVRSAKGTAETIHCKRSCSRQDVFGRQSFSKLEPIQTTVQKLRHSQPIKQRRR